jgi:diacylglycerol kinase (ATP)
MESPFKGKTGIKRLINAFGYSIEGFKIAFLKEDAFRQECYLSAVLIPLAFYLATSTIELSLLMGSILFVLIVELLNSSIEATVDRISLDQHPLSKRAKDTGSAAVFLAIVNAILIWFAILFF